MCWKHLSIGSTWTINLSCCLFNNQIKQWHLLLSKLCKLYMWTQISMWLKTRKLFPKSIHHIIIYLDTNNLSLSLSCINFLQFKKLICRIYEFSRSHFIRFSFKFKYCLSHNIIMFPLLHKQIYVGHLIYWYN